MKSRSTLVHCFEPQVVFMMMEYLKYIKNSIYFSIRILNIFLKHCADVRHLSR